jgi:hypothetical protein
MQIVADKQIILDVNFIEEEKGKLNEALALVTKLITECKKYGEDINMNDEDNTYFDVDVLIRAGAMVCDFMDYAQNCTFRIEQRKVK